MDINKEIKLIQEEFNDVKDPHLIKAFINILEYRKKKNYLNLTSNSIKA